MKHTEMLSREAQVRLWRDELLDVKTPHSLANAVFFGNGKNLCLRGGREHYSLKLSQFKFVCEEVRGEEREYVVYTENGSKNRSGSCKDKTPNKVVRHFAEPDLGERCYVSLLKKYYSVLPKEVFENPEALFYQHPKEETSPPGFPLFKRQPRGRNTLQTL